MGRIEELFRKGNVRRENMRVFRSDEEKTLFYIWNFPEFEDLFLFCFLFLIYFWLLCSNRRGFLRLFGKEICILERGEGLLEQKYELFGCFLFIGDLSLLI